MTDRLKEIWKGFAGTTERRLTGKGVDGIIVPSRADYDGVERQLLPEGFESPADRAFAALRADLKAKEKKFSKPKKRAGGDSAHLSADDPDPTAPDEQKWGEDDLNVGLWSTAMRVERTEMDYARFMSSSEGKKALKRTRKKRFGIF